MPGTRIVSRWLWAASPVRCLPRRRPPRTPRRRPPPPPPPPTRRRRLPRPPRPRPPRRPTLTPRPSSIRPRRPRSTEAPLGFAGQSGVLPRDPLSQPRLRPRRGPLAHRLPRLGPLRQGPSAGGRLPLRRRALVGPVQPERPQGRLPDHRPEHLPEHHGRAASRSWRRGRSRRRRRRSRARPGPASPTSSAGPTSSSTARYFSFSLDLFHGDAAFKPVDWRVKITPVFNVNNLNVNELATSAPTCARARAAAAPSSPCRSGSSRRKLADLSPDYDFVSVRRRLAAVHQRLPRLPLQRHQPGRAPVRHAGLQPRPVQPDLLRPAGEGHQQRPEHVRRTATRTSSSPTITARTSSGPATRSRSASTTTTTSRASTSTSNGFLVRPDPVGVFQPHEVDVVYLGWAGDGHIDRFNITHQFYWAVGHDSLNPLANQPQDINAQFAAAGAVLRPRLGRASAPRSSTPPATATSTTATPPASTRILDDPNFAGGEFSYWQRQADPAVRRQPGQAPTASIPDLRSSKIEGQSNFVNPGLLLLNFGVDIDLTPKLKMHQQRQFPLVRQDQRRWKRSCSRSNIHRFIGTDLSTGLEYRPLLSNNIIIMFGVSTLVPGQGFSDLYNQLPHRHATRSSPASCSSPWRTESLAASRRLDRCDPRRSCSQPQLGTASDAQRPEL